MGAALTLYGKEILQFDDSYPNGGIDSLCYLMKNKGDFFTKKNSQKSVEAVTSLFSEACKTTYGIDSLSKIRDKLVIYTLSGRDSKMLKQSHQLYTTQELITLDSCFYLIFHGAPPATDYSPKIFHKLIKDKLENPGELSQNEII
jgi:hypothetical protein